jgi:hypothetical protein
MSADVRLPIIGTAVDAWRDASRAIAAMPGVAGIAFALMLAVSIATLALFDPFDVAGSSLSPIVNLVSMVVTSALLAPLAIAVHRHVLLGQSTERYALDPSSPRYQRFVGFAILINFLWMVPNLIFALTPRFETPALSALAGIVGFVVVIVVIVVAIRRAILFPAIAVDAPGAGWRSARDDSTGHSWTIAFIFICTAIPQIVLAPVYLLYMSPGMQGFGGRVLLAVLSAVIQLPTVCAFAAAASHIYRAYANNLAKPVGATPSAAAV